MNIKELEAALAAASIEATKAWDDVAALETATARAEAASDKERAAWQALSAARRAGEQTRLDAWEAMIAERRDKAQRGIK
jgi:hypothetical protein